MTDVMLDEYEPTDDEGTQAETEFVPPTADEASTNLYWTFGRAEVFNLQTTIRGAISQEQILAHLESAMHAMVEIVEMGGHAKQVGYQAPATPSAAPPPMTTAPAVAPAAKPAPTKPATPSAAPINTDEFVTVQAVKMEVELRPDKKVNLKWFAAGHQYPDVYAAKTPAEAANLLRDTGGWTVEHFAAAESYDVAHAVTYAHSEKLNSKGKPYKNIIYVNNAD